MVFEPKINTAQTDDAEAPLLGTLTRRRFLALLGIGAAGCTVFPFLGAEKAGEAAWSFTPARLPHPLPIYATRESFLAVKGENGAVLRTEVLPASRNPF